MEREYKNIDSKLVNDIESTFGDKVEIENPRGHRVFITLDREDLVEVVKYLKDNHGLLYISTITGYDAVEHLEVMYHFLLEGTVLTIKAIVPVEDPQVDSIVEVIPGAFLYEREVNDLLGVFPKGHPDPRRQVLSDDWPEGDYPHRKNWPAKERGIR